jgi:ABC-type Fe3+-hydroxamate transport system substrate-binding protein
MNTKYFYHFGIFIFKYESLNNIYKKKNNKENHDLVNEIKEVKNNNIIIFDNNDENNEYGQYILIDL